MLVIVFFPLALFYVCLMIYYLAGWHKLKTFRASLGEKDRIHKLPHISVVISVRNEADNIEECINAILKQNYPASLFEIIVVDDFSTDDTCETIDSIRSDKISLLKLSSIPGEHSPNQPNKKYAINHAVIAAKGEIITVTDADCNMGEDWLKTIALFYIEKSPSFIAGPVLLKGGPQNLLTAFQKLDMLSMTTIAGAAISLHNPTLSNAANMTFSKKDFKALGGYGSFSSKPSGDDLFLMHKFEEAGKSIAYLKSFNAVVFSKTEDTFSAFLEQRKRWVSKSTTYARKSVTFTLLLAYLFNLSILLSSVLALSGNVSMLTYFITSISVKLFFDLIFLLPAAGFFKQSRLLFLFLPVQICHILYVVVIGILGMLFGYRWKGRKVERALSFKSKLG